MAIQQAADLFGIGSSIIGQKQVGPAAPAYQPGTMGGINQINQIGQDAVSNIPGLLGGAPSPVQEAVSALPQTPAAPVGPPEAEAPEKPGFGDTFFNSIDSTFSSPAKLIGMGLLNQQVGGLGTGLMLGKGLLDAFRR